MQPRGNLYTFCFAFVICLACSVGLAISATALKPFQITNYRLDIITNIVATTGFPPEKLAAMSSDEILKLYRTGFEGQLLDRDNRPVDRTVLEDDLRSLGYPARDLREMYVFELLETYTKKVHILADRHAQEPERFDPGYKLLFLFRPAGTVEAYILPIEGFGLWDMMYGYLALAPDLNTIKGIRFYNHKETPGLGAEAEKPWFTSQFLNKTILDESGQLVSIQVAKAKARNAREVDGISGATLTGKGISKFLADDLARYEPYFKTLRAAHAVASDGKGEGEASDTGAAEATEAPVN